jgi:hypothetical protein
MTTVGRISEHMCSFIPPFHGSKNRFVNIHSLPLCFWFSFEFQAEWWLVVMSTLEAVVGPDHIADM